MKSANEGIDATVPVFMLKQQTKKYRMIMHVFIDTTDNIYIEFMSKIQDIYVLQLMVEVYLKI